MVKGKVCGRGVSSKAFDAAIRFLDRYKSKKFKKIILNSIHGKIKFSLNEYLVPDTLHVLIYANPAYYKGNYKTINEIEWKNKYKKSYYSVLQGGQKDAFIFNINGWKDLKDEQGQHIGLYKNNILFLFFDLLDTDTNVKNLLKYILKKVEKDIQPLTRAQIDKLFFKNIKKDFVKIVSKSIESNLKNIETKKNLLIIQNSEIQSTYLNNLRDLRNINIQLGTFSKDKKTILKEAKELYERISKIKGVDKVWSNGEDIIVVTKDIIVTDSKTGNGYDFGKYHIIFQNDKVRIVNEVLKDINEIQHPHVDNYGHNICWGNFLDVLKLIAAFQYDIATNMIIQYLHHYNPDDAYTSIEGLHEKYTVEAEYGK